MGLQPPRSLWGVQLRRQAQCFSAVMSVSFGVKERNLLNFDLKEASQVADLQEVRVVEILAARRAELKGKSSHLPGHAVSSKSHAGLLLCSHRIKVHVGMSMHARKHARLQGSRCDLATEDTLRPQPCSAPSAFPSLGALGHSIPPHQGQLYFAGNRKEDRTQ